MTFFTRTAAGRRPAVRRWLGTIARQMLVVAVIGALLVLGPACAAWAHGAHAPTATNYRTEVTGLTPPVEGLAVRVVEGGTGLELTNHTTTPVQVLGYDDEPYLEVGPDGWFENTRSPATHLNQDHTGTAPVPEHADARAEPDWRRVEGGPVARWYDHRTHWMGTRPPPQVAAEPGTPHRVLDWAVPLRHGDTTLEITGTLDWVPPPSGWRWWTGAVLAAAAVAALGLAARARPARVLLAVLAMAGGATALAYAVARELDAGAAGAGEVVVWLATGLLWPALAGLAAVAAGTYLLVTSLRSPRPSEAAAVAVAVAGACLAIFVGLADAAVFTRSVPPVPFDPAVARAAVLAALAVGAGAAAAGALTLRRLRPTPHPPDGRS